MSYDITEYIEWLAIDYKDVNIQDLLLNILKIQQQYNIDIISQYSSKFDIDTADGIWLDYVGYRLGVFERPSLPIDNQEIAFGFDGSDGVGFDQLPFVSDIEDTIPLDDFYFRKFLRVKAQHLITTATEENIRSSLLLFFEDIFVIDNQNMTMSIDILTNIPINIVITVIENGIIIKPAAVEILLNIVDTEAFGFNGSDEFGFDQAPFVFDEV